MADYKELIIEAEDERNQEKELEKIKIDAIIFEEKKLYESFKKYVANPKTSKVGLYEIAKYLIKRYHIKTIGENNSREIYFYNDGYYDKRGASVIKSGIEDILE